MPNYSAKDCRGVYLDDKIYKYLALDSRIKDHVFIEVGANDGLFQSNTKMLEDYSYRGLLIEPSQKAFKELIENRSAENEFINNCCSSSSGLVSGDFTDGSPMSSIGGSRLGRKDLVFVKADTLTSMID